MNLKQKIMMAVTGGHNAFRTMQKFEWQVKQNALIDKALNSEIPGVSKEKLCEGELIVSLTTYGRRFYNVATTIESIMQGTVKPNRIILWLGEELKGKTLPVPLQKQIKRGLEIEYVKDIRSYKKLIPCLRKYPESYIITIDDDMIYDYDLVEKLLNTHLEYPEHIIANRIHRIILNKSGKPDFIRNWELCASPEDDAYFNLTCTGAGALFPPHCFTDEVFNEEVFLDICKYHDDVWFYAMSLLKGTRTRKSYTHNKRGEDYTMNWDVQDMGLCQINAQRKGKMGMNDIQFKAVFDKYNLYDKLK